MKMRFVKQIIIALALFFMPAASMAWGQQGHRICGQIADSYLSSKARRAIKAILGNESVAMASNWADFIKADSTYKYLYNWHFVDFDEALTYPQMEEYLKNDTKVDAYTKINFMVAELKKKDLPADKKLLYLRVLIHVVEDIHQPMHTGHESDKGGNDIKVMWFNTPTNLHSVWDSQLIDFQQLSYTEYAAAINFTTKAQRAEWQSMPVSRWVFESNQLAQQLYAKVKPDDKLSYRYNFENIATLNQQMVKAGVRLAGLLNQIFG